jgi:hypothetical protein
LPRVHAEGGHHRQEREARLSIRSLATKSMMRMSQMGRSSSSRRRTADAEPTSRSAGAQTA